MTSFLEYSDRDHKYYADGRLRLSVTQILNKAGMISEYCRDAEAQWRGSEVHELCAVDDDPLSPGVDLRKVDPRLRGYIRAWRLYRRDSGFMCEAGGIERRVDAQGHGYAGRLDRVGFRPTSDPLKFQQVILDIKTSKTGTVADYVRYQLVAYAWAYKPGHIFERIAVALRPDGQYRCKVFPMHEFQADLAKWFSILNSVKGENNPK
jgi:hypothetical protein